jgi:hypothetical protein
MKWLKKAFKSSAVTPTHKLTDDSGFLAIVDPDAYEGFVQKEWTLDSLRQRFAREMANRHLLIWSTGVGNVWNVQVSFQPTKASGFREIVGTINSSRGRLLLTNYESLTMAAGFADISLPGAHEQENVLQVQPGLYDCRLVQLSDPDTSAPFEEPVSFVYEFTPVTQAREAWSRIPWRAA